MKKTSTVAVFVLVVVVLVGLGVLFYEAIPKIAAERASFGVAVLIISVEAALFVLGVFVGYLYGRSVQSRSAVMEMRNRFAGALDFERKERLRLERNLFEANQVMISLRDQLSDQQAQLKKASSNKIKMDQATKIEMYQAKKMKDEITNLTAIHGKLRTDLARRKDRVADLQAELSVAQTEIEEARTETAQLENSLAPFSPVSQLSVDGVSLRDILERIVVLDGVRMALVADDYGLVVDAVGTEIQPETLAAISNLMERFGPQLRDILPIGKVAAVSLGDEQGLVLDIRYFDLLGIRCALVIARDEKHPYPGLAKEAVVSIAEKMAADNE
jgi:hypothetical protein